MGCNRGHVHCKQNYGHLLLICIFSILAILQSGLRDVDNYVDAPIFMEQYRILSYTPWHEVIDEFSFFSNEYEERDVGWPMFVKTTQMLYNDFRFFMFLIATIFLVSLSNLIYRYVKSYLGIILAYLIYFALYSIIVNALMRQAVAISIIMFSTKYVTCRNWKKYYSLLAVSFLIHSSSIVAFPLYFIPKYFSSRKKLLAAILVGISLIPFSYSVLSFVATGTTYEQYISQSQMNPQNYILLIIFVSLITYFYYNEIKRVENYKLLIAGVVGASVLLPIVSMGGALVRIMFYYSVLLMPLIPNIIDNIPEGRGFRVFVYFIALSFFSFYIVQFNIII